LQRLSFKLKLLIWLLENHRGLYFRLKKLNSLEVSRDNEFFDIHLELLRDGRGIQTLFERYNLYCLAKATAHLPGAMAEAGVFRGGSAKLLCKIKGETPLYLFDTFEGLPTTDKEKTVDLERDSSTKPASKTWRPICRCSVTSIFIKDFFQPLPWIRSPSNSPIGLSTLISIYINPPWTP
jgi:hypothetical protein